MIKRSTLRAQIATALRDEVLAGRLPAGSQFTVKEIAEQYGVSATPVREALVDLAAQGLVDVEQHRGFRVREFTLDDYRSMVEARTLVLDGILHRAETARAADEADPSGPAALSCPAPPAGPERADGAWTAGIAPETLASVRRRAEAAERAARTGDLDVLIGYDLRYWRELGGLLSNAYVCDFLDRLRMQCWVFTVPLLRREPVLAGRLWAGHRELAEAVARREPARARRLLAAYNAQALALVESCGERRRHRGP